MKIAILISGRGSNMRALLDACTQADYPAECVLVLSNRPDAAGLKVAGAYDIPTQVIDHTRFADRTAFEDALDSALNEAGAELICLAGFMRLLGSDFVNRWRDKILNVHPSLLPAYRGLHTHERVLEDGVRFTGCTIHFVRPEMDDGPILFQACVPVMPDDTPEILEDRVLDWEHKLYVDAVRIVAEGRLRISGRVVQFDDPAGKQPGIANPLLPDT